MGQSFIPAGYAPHLSLYETQSAISLIKRVFQDALSRELNLRRVSAPLFVEPSSGLNDDLNSVPSASIFPVRALRRRSFIPSPNGSAWRSIAMISIPARASTRI